MQMIRTIFLLLLAVMAVLSRLLPHPPNFTPIAALALFGGVYFEKRYAFILPLAVLLVSDAIIGFYAGIAWVYGSFLLIGMLGLWLRNHKGIASTAAISMTGSVIFFILTNFGVWLGGELYPLTPDGLASCYAAAIPFFRNTLSGDLFYVAILFVITELVTRRIPLIRYNGGDAGK